MIYYHLVLAPVCSIPLKIPDNADVQSTLDYDVIGQESVIECKEGFEFVEAEDFSREPLEPIG